MQRILSFVSLVAMAQACSSAPAPKPDEPQPKQDAAPAPEVQTQAAGNCAGPSAPLLTFQVRPDSGSGAQAMSIAFDSNGSWQRDSQAGCASAADRAAIAELAKNVKMRIESSNQTCPMPSSRTFKLEVSGKKPLEWGDGGCGTTLDPSVDQLLAKLREVTKP